MSFTYTESFDEILSIGFILSMIILFIQSVMCFQRFQCQLVTHASITRVLNNA